MLELRGEGGPLNHRVHTHQMVSLGESPRDREDQGHQLFLRAEQLIDLKTK